jgi:hypothetical protein
MNRQSHSSLGEKMPYEVFFGRKPRWEDRIPASQELQVDQVEDEMVDIVGEGIEDNFPDLSEIDIFDEEVMLILLNYNFN